MDNRRRQKTDYHQEVPGARSQTRKPPHGNWQPTVPSWEKKFCTSVGSLPWGKILEAKRFMYLYTNIVQWNDSAGEEAFYNAKERFWAEINGLPCNISLPDPDIYIDEIDWNSNVDPELLLDLERNTKVPQEVNKDEKSVMLNNTFFLNQSFSCTGWGDAEEGFKNENGMSLAPGHGDITQNAGNVENAWESNCAPHNGAVIDDGRGGCWNDSSAGQNQWENNYNEFNHSYNELKKLNDGTGGDWGTWDDNNRNRDGTGWYMSRYKTSRFQGDNNQMGRGWKNKKEWKRPNFACERSFMDEKHSSRRWNSINSCVPVNNNGFDKAGFSWGWEKQVI